MKRFIIKVNNNKKSKDISKWLLKELLKLNMIEDLKNPQWIFSIGGDGTLLKSINQFSNQLDNVNFIAINTGRIGFNTTFLEDDLKDLINLFKTGNLKINEQDALKIVSDDNKIFFAMNEVQLLRIGKTIRYDLLVNNNLLEQSQSSGFVVSTKNGSTGLIKSLKGSVIFSDVKLMQYLEIAPVQHLLQQTINTSIIFDYKEHLTIQGDLNKAKLIIDGYVCDFISNKLEISLVTNKIKFLVNTKNKITTILKLRKLFIKKE